MNNEIGYNDPNEVIDNPQDELFTFHTHAAKRVLATEDGKQLLNYILDVIDKSGDPAYTVGQFMLYKQLFQLSQV